MIERSERFTYHLGDESQKPILVRYCKDCGAKLRSGNKGKRCALCEDKRWRAEFRKRQLSAGGAKVKKKTK